MNVVFACNLIHLYDDLCRASHFNHRLPEGLVTDESVVDDVILLFAAFPCKLVRRMVSEQTRELRTHVSVFMCAVLKVFWGVGGHVVIGVVLGHHANVIPNTDFFPSEFCSSLLYLQSDCIP